MINEDPLVFPSIFHIDEITQDFLNWASVIFLMDAGSNNHCCDILL